MMVLLRGGLECRSLPKKVRCRREVGKLCEPMTYSCGVEISAGFTLRLEKHSWLTVWMMVCSNLRIRSPVSFVRLINVERTKACTHTKIFTSRISYIV